MRVALRGCAFLLVLWNENTWWFWIKTLLEVHEVSEMRKRLAAVTPDDAQRWGTMSAGEMVCHVRGAFRIALARFGLEPVPQRMPPRLMKVLALWMPVQWPHSSPTVAGLEQGGALVVPGGFAADHAEMMEVFDDFVAARQNRTAHPMFGDMSPRDWMRWGYLHTDHHLRQFGR